MAVDGKVKVSTETKKRGLGQIFRGLKAEIKRITWPSVKDVKKATIATAVFCLIYVIYVGLLDGAFGKLVDLIFRT